MDDEKPPRAALCDSASVGIVGGGFASAVARC
jgi:hypothetical protein